MHPRLGLALLALSASLPLRAAAQHPLVTLPLEDPAYVQLDALVGRGCAAARVSPYRPYLVRDVRVAIRRSAGQPRCAGPILDALAVRFGEPTLPDSARPEIALGAEATFRGAALRNGEFRPLWLDVRPTSQGTQPAVGIARLRVTWNASPHLVAVTEGFAQTGTRNDPEIREQRFRRTSGVVGFQDAYLTAQLSKLVISLGRSREAWLAEGAESPVLSAYGPAYDRLLLSARLSRFELRAFFATVNDVVLNATTDSLPPGISQQRWHRFLAAHAVTYRPTRAVEITAGETALIQREGFSIPLEYVNPLMLYQTTQHGSEETGAGDANLTGFLASRASLGPVALDGYFVVDDIQIDKNDRAIYPNQFAWRVGASYALPLAMPATIGAQYRHDDGFTYVGQKTYSKVYQQFDAPLGSELGPDADLARLTAELWPMGRLRLGGGLGRWRRGARRLTERPSVNRRGHANDPFPSVDEAHPDVQRAWLADLTAEWLDAVIPVTVRLEAARIDDVNNQPTAARNYGRATVTASYRFRYP